MAWFYINTQTGQIRVAWKKLPEPWERIIPFKLRKDFEFYVFKSKQGTYKTIATWTNYRLADYLRFFANSDCYYEDVERFVRGIKILKPFIFRVDDRAKAVFDLSYLIQMIVKKIKKNPKLIKYVPDVERFFGVNILNTIPPHLLFNL